MSENISHLLYNYNENKIQSINIRGAHYQNNTSSETSAHLDVHSKHQSSCTPLFQSSIPGQFQAQLTICSAE